MTDAPYDGDSKQLVIMRRLTTLLEGITPANGYSYDLAGKVYRGKTLFGSTEEPPFITILESLRPDPQPDEAGYERIVREERWELLIQGWAVTDQAHPTDALYNFKAAVEHRLSRIVAMNDRGSPLYPADFRLGRILTGARLGPGVVRMATPQTSGTEALYLPCTVRYKANVADPWALG